MAGMLFFMIYLFWEFFTPFNQFGEPLPLIALELVFWAVIALAEGMAIAWVMAAVTRYRLPETTRQAHRLASGPDGRPLPGTPPVL